MKDLFGNEISDPICDAKRGSRMDLAHPRRPGTGPAGKTCRDCTSCECHSYGRRNYYKCAIMRRVWTKGPGTDIRLKDLACSAFLPR